MILIKKNYFSEKTVTISEFYEQKKKKTVEEVSLKLNLAQFTKQEGL